LAKARKTKAKGECKVKADAIPESKGSLEFVRVEKDLEETLKDDSSIVDEDMRGEELRMPRVKAKSKQETVERPQPEYRGVKLFYSKFVSRLRNALK